MDPSLERVLPARLSQEEIKEVYRKLSPVYDFWGNIFEAKARKRCLELAAIQNGEAILEVAVGTGLTFAEIVATNSKGRNEGIELTPAMLSRARERLQASRGNFKLASGDAYSLSYPDRAFDVLINNYMFDLLPEHDFVKVLLEFRRVLKPGGRLAMVNMTKGVRFYQQLVEQIYRINPKLMGGCRGVLLEEPIRKAGFSLINREFISQAMFPSEVILAKA